MKTEKDKALDDFFKKNLEDPVNETGYREEDWDALEQLLDKPKKRPGIVFWLTALSSAAALLLFFGWLFFKSRPVLNEQQQAVVIHHTSKNADLNKANTQQSNIGKKEELKHNDSMLTVITEKSAIGNEPAKKQLVFIGPKQVLKNIPNSGYKGLSSNNNQPIEETQYSNNTITLAATNKALIFKPATVANEHTTLTSVTNKDIIGELHKPAPLKEEDENEVTKLGFLKHPQYALTFIGAPELNSTTSFDGSKTGTNFGLLFSAGIFKNLTVSTGATYSTKSYNTDVANYHTNYTFKNNPSEIEADCRMVDIPVNVDYQLYNKHKNKFSIGTGLSSYIMLHESYQYYYANAATGPTGFTVPHSGKYFFGIANVQATYQRQVNSKVGISVQPYMKLPLSNIGYSQVRLQTVGVAIGLNWKLNSLTKP
ncbi:MAG TPA: hypothetical protein VGC01_11030 [Mucilaginibacter sp.]